MDGERALGGEHTMQQHTDQMSCRIVHLKPIYIISLNSVHPINLIVRVIVLSCRSLSFVIESETIYVRDQLVIFEATTAASHTHSFSECMGGSGTVRSVGAGAHAAPLVTLHTEPARGDPLKRLRKGARTRKRGVLAFPAALDGRHSGVCCPQFPTVGPALPAAST